MLDYIPEILFWKIGAYVSLGLALFIYIIALVQTSRLRKAIRCQRSRESLHLPNARTTLPLKSTVKRALLRLLQR